MGFDASRLAVTGIDTEPRSLQGHPSYGQGKTDRDAFGIYPEDCSSPLCITTQGLGGTQAIG